ncbi:hypothetical protein ACPYPG_33320 [Streptomyces sp. FR-108]|uniref:hypothetical protein n=1 Tax=Streptomyces sp. FR-108 TaxID=3416665 RepID=UPI003CF0732A
MDITSGLLENLENLEAEETRRTIWPAINASVGAISTWIAHTCALLARAENARIDVRSGARPIPDVMNEVLWEHTPVQQVIGRVATTDIAGHGRRPPDPAGPEAD